MSQEDNVNYGKMFGYGALGLGGYYLGRSLLKREEKFYYNNYESVRNFYDKHKIKPGLKGKRQSIFNNLKEEIRGYRPGRTRLANEWDETIHGILWPKHNVVASEYEEQMINGTKKSIMTKAGTKMATPSAQSAFMLLSVNQEMQQRGLGGIGVGMAREVGASLGYRIGSSVGGFVGGAVGGVIGGFAIDVPLKMAKIGRRWSIPDVGGHFKDSEAAMTMRARSLNAIRTSQFNVRSTLGNEAWNLNYGMY